MAAQYPQIGVGSRAPSTATWLSADLGKIYVINGNEYMLVQLGAAAIATPASLCLKGVLTAGLLGVNACVLGSVNNEYIALGTFDAAQVALSALDFCLVQIAGFATYIADAAVSAGAQIGSGGTTAGRISSATISGAGIMGVSTSAPGGAGTAGKCLLSKRF